jgi:carbon-monoxide dehydrogenase medium subunit
VKFPEFDYVRPATIESAVEALQANESRPLAGGQSLMPLLAFRLSRPELLVDVSRLRDLRGIAYDESSARLTLGAAVTHREIANHATIARHAPFLAAAAAQIGHQAIRSRGTIGGSIAHSDPAAEWPAVAIALDCTVELRSATSIRRVSASDFIAGPYMTTIEPGELLTSIEFDLSSRPRVGLTEAARRPGDFALAGAICVATERGSTDVDVSLTLFGVTSQPSRRQFASAVAGSATPATVTAEAHDWIDSLADVLDDVHSSAGMRKHIARQVADEALASTMEQIRGRTHGH